MYWRNCLSFGANSLVGGVATILNKRLRWWRKEGDGDLCVRNSCVRDKPERRRGGKTRSDDMIVETRVSRRRVGKERYQMEG